jgi:hypothetical protein
MTINGLAILDEWPTLDLYFQRQVVGGPNHFVIVANDYEAYGRAIHRKLLQEITGPGVSHECRMSRIRLAARRHVGYDGP